MIKDYLKKVFISLLVFSCVYSMHAQIGTFPYVEDFESGTGGWTVHGNNPSWELGTPANTQTINQAASGDNAWVTNLDGDYNNLDQSWVESPPFDLSALTNPVIQLNIWWSLETVWDGAYVESSIDDGSSWQIIGGVGTGLNWYTHTDIYPGINTDAWSNNSSGWKTAANYITNLAGQSNVKFRIYLLSNNNTTREGVAFDDFLIYDRPANILIPDSEFEQYLVNSGKDTDGSVNGQIAEEDCLTISSLSPSNYDIEDFEGLQYFTGLSNFSMSGNTSGSINTIDFSGNSNLLELFIYGPSNISDINFGINPRLDTISISGNGSNFSTIDLSNIFKLGALSLSNLGLTALNLEHNKHLYSIDLSNNPLNTLNTPLLPNLDNLDVSNTLLSLLDVSWFDNLATLNTSFTNIVNLDLSYNPNIQTLIANNGLLQSANLQISSDGRESQRGSFEIANVDLQNNPNLACILVNNVFLAENNSNWFKDNTATYIDTQNVQLLTSAQNVEEFFEDDLDQIILTDWLNNNGGATVATDCMDLTWNYIVSETYFDEDGDFFDDDLLLDVDFGYNNGSGFVILSSAQFTYYDLPIIGFGNGSNGALCDIESYELQTLFEVDITAPSYSNSNIIVTVSPNSDGFGDTGGSISKTKVDFPDKGAGNYTFIYDVNVRTNISAGNFSTSFDSSAEFFVNEVNITFNSGEDRMVPICTGGSLSIQELTDALKITPSLSSNPPQDGFDPNDYWFDSEGNNITSPVGAGAYTFDPTIVFELSGCPFTITTLTLVEYNDLTAGPDVIANDPSSYKCGDTISFNLNDYLDVSAGLNGDWYLGFDLIPNGIIEFSNFGAGSFTKTYNYRIQESSCWPADEAVYEIAYNVIERSAGLDGTLLIENGTTVTEEALFAALLGSPDSNGIWSPALAGAGIYTYTIQATTGCLEQTASVTVSISISDLRIKTYLQGASLNPNTGEETLMRDDLRVLGYIPLISPYADLLTCEASVFTPTGPDAIVDWIWVELRDANDNTAILASKSALLQRDGDIVDVDGLSSLSFDFASGNYYIVLNHRNHLGIMTATSIVLNESTSIVDFTDAGQSTYGNLARTSSGMPINILGMWTGDGTGDGKVSFSEETNKTLIDVILEPSNITFSSNYDFVNGYYDSDALLDGNVSFSGEVNQVLLSVILFPGNVTYSSQYNEFVEQLPSPSNMRSQATLEQNQIRALQAEEIKNN
ncbi:MAG: hypothetical protein DA407_00275 [Bacteroidetes bacterium]|nr:MAG: hypothetical protein DA407_00275 [Bacteroidota bacterium]